jgi:hypothetical protein
MSKHSKCSVHTACIQYKVSYHKEHHGISPSLADKGATGGVAGNDIRVIFKTNRTLDIKGIDNHRCTNINIGSSIHSPCQFGWCKNDVNDKSILVPGDLQRIQTLDGYIVPLRIQDGLTRLNIRPIQTKNLKHCPTSYLHLN